MTETKELAVRNAELDRYARLGQWLAASETGSDDVNAKGAAAALRLFYADALGLPPLAAAELSVIKGRLFVQAKLLRALAVRHGYRVRREQSTPDTCTAVLEEIDSGREIGRTTFTLEDARKAGLVRDRSAWQTHPARMLWARASKYVLDDYAPEVTLGLATDDEADEFTGKSPVLGEPEPQSIRHDAEPVEEAEFEPIPPSKEQQDEFFTPPPLPEHYKARLTALFQEKEIGDRQERLSFAMAVTGRELTGVDDLSKQEADLIIRTLEAYDANDPDTYPFPRVE